MFPEGSFDQKLLQTAGFATRILLSGAIIPAGIADINQQLLDQQISHTLNISAQVAPLPFRDPIIPNCLTGISLNARYFKESDSSTLSTHDRFADGKLKYQTGDIILGPAQGQIFDVTDGKSPLQRLITDANGAGIRVDGKVVEIVKSDGSIEKRSDIVDFNRTSDTQVDGKYAMTVGIKKSDWNFAEVAKIPCGEFQPFPVTIYNQSADQTPNPSTTPNPTRTAVPTIGPNLDLYYAVNNLGYLIPKGQRAVEIDLDQVIQSAQATATAEVKPATTPTPEVNRTVEALAVRAAAQDATQTAAKIATQAVATYEANQQTTPTNQKAESNNPLDTLGKFKDWSLEHWWIYVGGLIVVGVIWLWRRRP